MSTKSSVVPGSAKSGLKPHIRPLNPQLRKGLARPPRRVYLLPNKSNTYIRPGYYASSASCRQPAARLESSPSPFSDLPASDHIYSAVENYHLLDQHDMMMVTEPSGSMTEHIDQVLRLCKEIA